MAKNTAGKLNANENHKESRMLFAKKDVINTIISIIIGFIIGYFFYYIGINEPKPIASIDPLRTEILKSDTITDEPIKIIRKENGKEITSDITAVRFYFWNDGSQPIRKEDILKPISILLSDSTGEILSVKRLAISDSAIDFELKRDSEIPNRKLNIDFKILEKADGASYQLTYVGNPRADFLIDGRIVGVKKIETRLIISSLSGWIAVIALILLFILIIISAFIDKQFAFDLSKLFLVTLALFIMALSLLGKDNIFERRISIPERIYVSIK